MELIDKKTLKDAECDECSYCATDSNFKREVERCRAEGCGIMDRIDRQPVIDAVPVVHGHWIKNSGNSYTVKCSNCKSERLLTDSWFEYCPRCGARMDGDE